MGRCLLKSFDYRIVFEEREYLTLIKKKSLSDSFFKKDTTHKKLFKKAELKKRGGREFCLSYFEGDTNLQVSKLDGARAGITEFVMDERIQSTVISLLYHFTF